MKLSDLSQSAYDASERSTVQLLQESRPELDLRLGTSLRDLLVRPAAQLSGVTDANTAALRGQFSIAQATANPEAMNPALFSDLLSNYGLSMRSGAYARGEVLVKVSVKRDYSVSSAVSLTISGLLFHPTTTWVVRANGVVNPATDLPLLPDNNGGWYFALPVVASATGGAYNVSEGLAVASDTPIAGSVSGMVTYSSFSGGADAETVADSVVRLPAMLARISLDAAAPITLSLLEAFPQVVAVSVAGRGAAEITRDRRNPFGFSTGVVAVYVRTFKAPNIVTLRAQAAKLADGVYQFSISPLVVPGLCSVRAVTSPASVITSDPTGELAPAGSFPLTETWSPFGTSSSGHEFYGLDAVVDTAYSVYQSCSVVVTNVPPVPNATPAWPDTLELKAEVYAAAGLDAIQAHLDNAQRRDVASDMVARSAVPCHVTIRAAVTISKFSKTKLSDMAAAAADYVNSTGIGGEITASGLASVFHAFDIKSVDLGGSNEGDALYQARLRKADGTWAAVNGQDVSGASFDDPALLASARTIAFTCDVRNVFLTEIIV